MLIEIVLLIFFICLISLENYQKSDIIISDVLLGLPAVAIKPHSPTVQDGGEKGGSIMENLKKIEEEYIVAFPKRDFHKVRKLLHPIYSYTGGEGQHREGAEAALEVIERYTTAFPDLRIEVKRMLTTGKSANTCMQFD